MVALAKSTIREKVRQILDEAGLNESEFAAIDGNEHDDGELDVLIEGRAEEALRFVYEYADASLVPWVHASLPLTDSSVGNITVDTGYVSPYSVVRLFLGMTTVWRWSGVGLSSWGRLFTPDDVLDMASAEVSKLRDKHSTGTWERPYVAVRPSGFAVTVNGEPSTELMLFSAKNADGGTGQDTVELDYVSKPAYVGDVLQVGTHLVDAFYYYLAGLVCMTLGDERQKGFFQQAAELMGKKTENNE